MINRTTSSEKTALPLGSVLIGAACLLAMALWPHQALSQIFEMEFGSFGDGPGQFNGPMGIAIDAEGHIYVSEFYSHRVQKFDRDGNFLAQIGSFGSGDGQFIVPMGLALDAEEHLYVVDSANGRIQKFDRNGQFLLQWGQFDNPQYIDVDSAGHVYVTEPFYNRVQKFDGSGNFLAMWGQDVLDMAVGLAVDAASLYVYSAHSQQLHKFDLNGNLLAQWPISGHEIAVAPSGVLHITDMQNHRVYRFEINRNLLAKYGDLGADTGQFNRPSGIAADAEGAIYVADFGNNRVQKFTRDQRSVGITTPDTTSAYNRSISIPVYFATSHAVLPTITSGHIRMVFDGDLLRFNSVHAQGALMEGWSLRTRVAQGANTAIDTLKIDATHTAALQDNGPLFYMQFQVADVRAPAVSPLGLSLVYFNEGRTPSMSLNGSLRLIGSDGRLASAPAQFAPGEEIAVTLVDRDADADGMVGSDRVEGRAINPQNGDELALILREDAEQAGHFSATVATRYGAGAIDDDWLQVQAGDRVEFSAVDALDAEGQSTRRTAQSTAIGEGGAHSAATIASSVEEEQSQAENADSPAQGATPAAMPNRVLQLDGQDCYVQLPGGLFDRLEAATVEAWVRWDDWDYFSQWFAFGADDQFRAMGINHFERQSLLQFFIYPDNYSANPPPPRVVRAQTDLALGQWCHMAAVSGPGGMRFYLDGALLGQHGYEGSLAALGAGPDNYLGKSNWAPNHYFRGGLDEVRVWSVERSQAQIRADMGRRLHGDEAGLVGLWNFDGSDAADASPQAHHGLLQGEAHTVAAPFPGARGFAQPAVVRGTVRDAEGLPRGGALVRLRSSGGNAISMDTRGDGRFALATFSPGAHVLDSEPPNALIPPRALNLQAGETLHLNLHPFTDALAQWSAAGDARDNTGERHGALHGGAAFAPGVAGQAFRLDGIDDYVRVPHHPALAPAGSFSLLAWVFPTSEERQTVIGKWQELDERDFLGGYQLEWQGLDERDFSGGYQLVLLPGHRVDFSMGDRAHQGDLAFISLQSPPRSIALNAWNHVAAVYDQTSGTRRIYVDGALVAERVATPIVLGDNRADLLIGAAESGIEPDPIAPFAGRIDEVALYDRALSQGEVQHLYGIHAQGRWSAEGNANDATRFDFDGLLVPPVSFARGITGQAFDFEQGGYVELPVFLGHAGTADFTAEWWLWSAAAPGQRQPLLVKRQDEDNALEVYLDEAQRVQAVFKSGGDMHRLVGKGIIAEGEWHHLALVRRGRELDLYLDGRLDAAHAAPVAVDAFLPVPLLLGGAPGYEHSFAGRLDEVAWHSRALSGEEILAIYEDNIRSWYWSWWRGRLQIGGVALVALVALVYSARYHGQRRARQAERREREAQLAEERQARAIADAANRAKSAFLANMSHEIRTPMNAILGYAQILRNYATLPPDQRRAVEAIYTSGDHLLELVNDVLDLSKIEAGRVELQPVDFDLRQLVEGLGTMFQLRCQQKDLVWRLEQSGEDWLVRGDQNKLRQVLVNLLGNAVKFTAEGEVHFAVAAREGAHSFSVRDTGPGIPAEGHEEIFAPFQQGAADVAGTGLGLAIARLHVELMGGQLEVDSAVGQGARFFFSLPLARAQGPVASQRERRYGQVVRLAAGHVPQVLVVDDVATNREILVQILEGVGAQVRQVASGAEALAAVDDRCPDLVFMDIRMPGMNGIETLHRLRQKYQGLPIAAVSASVMAHQKQYYLDVGFDAFVDKPFRLEALYACLEKILGVEYEYAESTAESAPPTADFAGMHLPAPLRAQLRQALEMHNVTRIRQCLELLLGLGPREKALAAHLDALVQQLDMDAALRALERTVDG